MNSKFLLLMVTLITSQSVFASTEIELEEGEALLFGGRCVTGLSQGQMVDTDCKTRMTFEDGKVLCFSSRASRDTFLQDPEGNLEKAKKFAALTPDADQNTKTEPNIPEALKKAGREITPEEGKAFIKDHLEKNIIDGVYPFIDPRYGTELPLVYDEILFVRRMHGYGVFPSVKFHHKDNPDKQYVLDFWLKAPADQIEIMDIRLYKEPKKVDDSYVLATRLPAPWWWLPASEHPGESEEKRGWEIMSAIHEHIADQKRNNNGFYKLKDSETGEEIDLDFVDIHMPVRKLKEDGRYFACTDFREKDSKEKFYDIDFWLDEKTGEIKVGDVRIHKIPQNIDGRWIQIPRYDFENLEYDEVP